MHSYYNTKNGLITGIIVCVKFWKIDRLEDSVRKITKKIFGESITFSYTVKYILYFTRLSKNDMFSDSVCFE